MGRGHRDGKGGGGVVGTRDGVILYFANRRGCDSRVLGAGTKTPIF